MTRTVRAEVFAVVDIEINDEDAIERITGPRGDEWRKHLYSNIHDERDVVTMFAYNAVANGVETASRLDGWADLPREAVTMRVTDVWLDDYGEIPQ